MIRPGDKPARSFNIRLRVLEIQLFGFHVTREFKETQIQYLDGCAGRTGPNHVFFSQRMTQAVRAWVPDYYQNVDPEPLNSFLPNCNPCS